MSFKILHLLIYIAFVLAINLTSIDGQENAQTRIPSSLTECYENADIYERDNRLPASINTLIELIRKIEDVPEYTPDIKQVAVGLLHRFRMDGIKHATGNFHPSVLPFSPSEYQFSKHRLLLSRLIPGDARNFPNNSLSSVERCSLHFLLSSSIDTQVRGDESIRCGQLAQFRSSSLYNTFELSRKKRYSNIPRNNYICDIEMMSSMNDQGRCQSYRKRPRFRTTTQRTYYDDEESDTENDLDDIPESDFPYDMNPVGRDLIDVASNAVSQCPVENGVIRTAWGAVAAGPLIAGIAAGIMQQSVATRELLLLTRNYGRQPHHHNHQRQHQVQLNVDNRWAATLSGDLSEVTLLQGPIGQRDVSVGASGAWNSTTVPKWYFLAQRERLEMTDAEIRGGIDGLALGLNIAEWRRQTSQLKLSQLLDMYYSNRGVLSSSFRSCNRRELFSKIIQSNQLQIQTMAFSTVLDREMQLRVTLTNANIEHFSKSSSDALVSYVENGLNDVTCSVTSALSSETRVASDLHIFIDFTWQYLEVQPAIAFLLENLDVNRFGTRYTLYNANDVSVIINTTNSLSNFYMLWNQTSHQTQPTGLNLAAIVKQLRLIGTNILNEDHSQSRAGGRSFISLVVPQLTPVNEADSNFVAEQLVNLRESIPDLQLLFWAGGAAGRFARFVIDQQRDLFQLMAFSSGGAEGSQQIQSDALPVIQRIQNAPRKLVNPRCTTDGWSWSQSDWGSNTFDQYVEPSGVNFYRLLPNYFYRSGGTVRVQSRTQIIVCVSRYVERPRYSNVTSQSNTNVGCSQLLPNDNYNIDLTNACEGHYLIQTCPPFYVSVQSAPQATQNNYQCSEPNCRFPDETKYTITIENLGCYSSSSQIMSKVSIMLLPISIHFFIQKFNLF